MNVRANNVAKIAIGKVLDRIDSKLFDNFVALCTKSDTAENQQTMGTAKEMHDILVAAASDVRVTKSTESKGIAATGPPKVTTLLALDLGTTTGWALRVGGAKLSGVWNLKPGRYDGGGMRYLRFKKLLDELHAASPIEIVYYEEVRRHAGTDAAHVYGGLMGTLTSWCEENEIPYEGVPVGSIKKATTGKGNADKTLMVSVIRGLGFNVIDDNEADAVALREMKINDGP